MREPFIPAEIQGLTRNLASLKKNGCEFTYTDDVVKSFQKFPGDEKGQVLLKMMSEGYLTLIAPQLGIRILYVKVYGGKGMLWGKKFIILFINKIMMKKPGHHSVHLKYGH